MVNNVTPEKVIAVAWLSVLLSCSWPLPTTATKLQVAVYKMLRITCILSATLLLLPLAYGIYIQFHDHITLTKLICIFGAVFHVVLQTVVFGTQYDRLKLVIEEMQTYCKNANAEQRRVLQKYIDKCKNFYGGSIAWFYGTASVLCVGPLFIPQPFPTPAEYPFPTVYFPLKMFIYLHQCFVLLQIAAHVCINSFCALLLWFASARFKILMEEMQKVTEFTKFVACIREHEHIKSYASEVTLAVRYVALMTIGFSTCALMFCGYTFITHQPLAVTVQFTFLSITALLESFMCAWPADHLTGMSTTVPQGTYESLWYKQTVQYQKNVVCILMPQKPVTVSLKLVMPVLSLDYYCKYLSNAFSAFTALRVVLAEN